MEKNATRSQKRVKILVDLDYDYDEFYVEMRDFIMEHIKMMAEMFNYKLLSIKEERSENNHVHIYVTLLYDGDTKKLSHFLYSLGDDPNHTRLSIFRSRMLGSFITYSL